LLRFDLAAILIETWRRTLWREPEGPNQRTGAIYGYLAPVVAAPRTPGVWQTYDITLVGRLGTVVLNGKTLIDKQEIPGITGGAPRGIARTDRLAG
jgi:hypothetical protein